MYFTDSLKQDASTFKDSSEVYVGLREQLVCVHIHEQNTTEQAYKNFRLLLLPDIIKLLNVLTNLSLNTYLSKQDCPFRD